MLERARLPCLSATFELFGRDVEVDGVRDSVDADPVVVFDERDRAPVRIG